MTTVYTVYIRFGDLGGCKNKKEYGGERLIIFINNKSGVPIYEQIYEQLKSHIISGELKEDDPLPSIRSLAKDLRISVITTKRAYYELERDGYVYTVASKGFFVAAKNVELLREENLKKIETNINEIIKLSKSCNLGYDEIIEMFNTMWRNEI